MLFIFFFPQCLIKVHVHIKGPESWNKVQVHSNRSSTIPQKTLLLKHLVSSPALSAGTLWHHYITMLHLCIIHASRLVWHSCSVVSSDAGSGVCELTNQRLAFERQALKRQRDEVCFRQRTEYILYLWFFYLIYFFLRNIFFVFFFFFLFLDSNPEGFLSIQCVEVFQLWVM